MRRREVKASTFLAFSLLLSACSSPSPLAALTDGPCTDDQKVLTQTHISAQINAIAQEDFVTAYSFAAPSFRASIDLEQFELIIRAQYRVLISNQGFSFDECRIEDAQIRQQVSVTGVLQDAKLSYTLEVDELKLGVIAASIIDAEANINT
ncbi:MAG: DUF4864 domain-containing protein [Actinobacteria bacterium]|uniref:Unannotated protein n=1 Tax=freshwater metagenome TaxID=449393 RepID=A0A6J6NEJ8_9ZZZZ|nr:DUF4864 domain-containing protein [Actinomycetota bacterium]